MKKALVLAVLANTFVLSAWAQVQVKYDCSFVANKDVFSKEHNEAIDKFIATREKATTGALVRALGGNQAEVKASVDAVVVDPTNFSIDTKLQGPKAAQLTVSGVCKLNYRSKEAFGVNSQREKTFAHLVAKLSHQDILAIEDYIAKIQKFDTPIDRKVSVESDLSYESK